MKIALIVNPVSGRGRSLGLLPKVVAWSKKNNIQFRTLTTQQAGDGVKLGRLALGERHDRIVVLGGDGTINEVGQAMAGTPCVMGVLPGGSGNDFFKMLGNGKDLQMAIRTAFLGDGQPIDIGLANGRPFFNAVGIGFDAEVAARAMESKIFSGTWVYLSAVFKVLKKFKPYEFNIELDQFKLTEPVTLSCVGNGRWTGGRFMLTPQAHLDDSLFDICIIEGVPRRRIFRYLPRAIKGTHIRLEGVRMFRSRKVVVRSKEKFPVHIDGEVATSMEKLEIVLDKRKLIVAFADKVK